MVIVMLITDASGDSDVDGYGYGAGGDDNGE